MFTCKHVDHVRVNHLLYLPCYKQNYDNVSIWLNQNNLYYTTAHTLILTFVDIIGTIFNVWNCCWFLMQMLSRAPEDQARLQDYCAVSVFVKILMLRGYSFDETTFPHISFQKKV